MSKTTKTTAKTKTTKKAVAKKKPAAKTTVVTPETVSTESVVPTHSAALRLTHRRLGIVLAIAVLTLAAGVGVWKYMDTQNQLTELKKSQKSTEEREKELVSEVRKIVVVPSNEEPIVREVDNLKSLADQVFYSQAELGDRVLLFPNAKKAVLYRPSTKQIVNISNNIVVQQNNNQQAPTTNESTP